MFNIDAKKLRDIFLKSTLLSVTFALAVVNNLVDQFYVTLNGIHAAHAYTIDVPIYWILLSSATALSAVYSGEIGRHLNMGDRMSADVAAIRSVVYSLVFGLVFALILWLIVTPILFVYIEDEETMENAFESLTPLLMLYFCMAMSCVLGGILNAEGKIRLYTGTLLSSVVANIGFGYLFVEELDMGMFGNGLSTALGSMLSLIIMLWYICSGKTKIRLSLKNFVWSFESVKIAFTKIQAMTARLIVRDSAELAIRFSLYLSYALTYGIPMLFSKLIAALGSGAGAYLSSEYSKLYAERDYEGTIRQFVMSIIIGGGLLFLLSMVLFIFAEPVASIFTMDPSLEDGKDTLVWTMRVLVFTAPFLGLKHIISALWTPIGKKEKSIAYELVTQVTKVVIFIYTLGYDYRTAIIMLLVMRIASTIFSINMAVVGIRTVYKKHCVPSTHPSAA
ncbi:MAG: hypothetical protein J6Y18_01235 [Candidatus Methanomethylophilaceae archaeon]|nr:hypothetical protein [Candidatus Methanomethylophilaceae archaeon]